MDVKHNILDPLLVSGQGQQPERSAARKNDPEALRKTCQQFEAIFTQQLFKGMRATVPSGALLENERSVELFQGLMDQQVAQSMARHQGLGIAEALLRHLQSAEEE